MSSNKKGKTKSDQTASAKSKRISSDRRTSLDQKTSDGRKTSEKTDTTEEFEIEEYVEPRNVVVSIMMKGKLPENVPELTFATYFDGSIKLETKWKHEAEMVVPMFLNLKDAEQGRTVANAPLLFMVRLPGVKIAGKEHDPLENPDIRAGGTLDLLPLMLGQNEINARVRLNSLPNGEYSGLKVIVNAEANGEIDYIYYPLLVTMVSMHCVPTVKDNTFFLAALELDMWNNSDNTLNFGLSLSDRSAQKQLWADISSAGIIASSGFNVPDEDRFIPNDLEAVHSETCSSVYWNCFRRALIYDPYTLRDRLTRPFRIEIAGLPRVGNTDVRGWYTGTVDAAVLLEPGEDSVVTCAKLKYFSDSDIPSKPLLDLPLNKTSARDKVSEFVMDDQGHYTYVVIRFCLMEPLVPKLKISSFFETLGFAVPEGGTHTSDVLHVDPPPEDLSVDARKIRVEEGALAVHKELSVLACRGTVPMNQSIKRTAANKLMMRVRTMLKQFEPEICSQVMWQDTVTGQHAAARRAVSASFAPQAPKPRLTSSDAAFRCRMALDDRIAQYHIEHNLNVAPDHPRTLLSKVLRCLELRDEENALMYTLKGLTAQVRSKYLLWIYGGTQYYKGEIEKARVAFRYACKGDHSDGTGKAIAYAAFHAVSHYERKIYSAFVAAKRMRKCYELPNEWQIFYDNWVETSGESEVYWMPKDIRTDDPMLITAAFFLCLRCYRFSEQILQCMENGCSVLGSRLNLKNKITSDVYYLRAASYMLRRQPHLALEVIEAGILKFGPIANLLEIRVTCLMVKGGWNVEGEKALVDADRAGSAVIPSVLLQSAMFELKRDPVNSLQKAARAHKLCPSAHTALALAECYAKLNDMTLAERWVAVAVKLEPLLADAWAFSAILAMRVRNVDLARVMLRTAVQVGPLSDRMQQQVNKLSQIIRINTLSDSMTKEICFCNSLAS